MQPEREVVAAWGTRGRSLERTVIAAWNAWGRRLGCTGVQRDEGEIGRGTDGWRDPTLPTVLPVTAGLRKEQ